VVLCVKGRRRAPKRRVGGEEKGKGKTVHASSDQFFISFLCFRACEKETLKRRRKEREKRKKEGKRWPVLCFPSQVKKKRPPKGREKGEKGKGREDVLLSQLGRYEKGRSQRMEEEKEEETDSTIGRLLVLPLLQPGPKEGRKKKMG